MKLGNSIYAIILLCVLAGAVIAFAQQGTIIGFQQVKLNFSVDDFSFANAADGSSIVSLKPKPAANWIDEDESLAPTSPGACVYRLKFIPYGKAIIYRNGLKMTQGYDHEVTGNDVTFTRQGCANGDYISATYRH